VRRRIKGGVIGVGGVKALEMALREMPTGGNLGYQVGLQFESKVWKKLKRRAPLGLRKKRRTGSPGNPTTMTFKSGQLTPTFGLLQC